MFRYKLQQFLYGRYGNDNFNNFIIAVVFVCAILNLFARSNILYLIQIIVFGFWIFRYFSKNAQARRNENEKYLSIKNRFVKNTNYGSQGQDYYNTSYETPKTKVKKDKDYKYFKCPNCCTKLRVPKHKGKITITCPKCKTSFKGKS